MAERKIQKTTTQSRKLQGKPGPARATAKAPTLLWPEGNLEQTQGVGRQGEATKMCPPSALSASVGSPGLGWKLDACPASDMGPSSQSPSH